MDATTIQGLHGTLGCARVVILNEAVVEALGLNRAPQSQQSSLAHNIAGINETYVLVGDDLDVLNVTGSLKDLAQNILRDTRVQATDVESSLVRLGRRAPGEGTAAGGRHDLVTRHGRGDRGRNRVRVGRDVERRGRHVGVGAILTVLVAWSPSTGLGRRRKLASRRNSVCHAEQLVVEDGECGCGRCR